MSDKEYKGGMHNGLSTLIKAIETLTHKKVNLPSDEEKLDVATIRRREAHLASIEIAKQRQQRHQNFIDTLHKQGHISGQFTFDKIKEDDFNRKAIEIAKSFCSTLNLPKEFVTTAPLFLIQGGPGSGKTVLCNCVANEFLVKHFKEVEMCTFSQIKRNRTPGQTDNSFDVQEKAANWEKYISVDLLIIDGFCQNNENLTQFDRQVFAELLRIRNERNLPIVISTTLAASSIAQKLGDDCFESIKEYNVFTASLLGYSRRQPIIFS